MRLPKRLEGKSEQELYIYLGVIAVAILFVIGFVVKNSHGVDISFVLFSTSVSLIWVMLVPMAVGVAAGFALHALAIRARTRPRDAPPADERSPDHPSAS